MRSGERVNDTDVVRSDFESDARADARKAQRIACEGVALVYSVCRTEYREAYQGLDKARTHYKRVHQNRAIEVYEDMAERRNSPLIRNVSVP